MIVVDQWDEFGVGGGRAEFLVHNGFHQFIEGLLVPAVDIVEWQGRCGRSVVEVAEHYYNFILGEGETFYEIVARDLGFVEVLEFLE